MAGNKSNSLANDMLDAIFQTGGYGAPVGLYLALYTVNPGDDDSGTEVDATSYERVDISNKFQTPASNREIKNDAEIEFPEAEESWGTVTHVGVRTHDGDPTAGELLWWAELEVEKVISAGDQLRFRIDDLTFGYKETT